MTFAPFRQLEGEVLRDLVRRPPCRCRMCRTGMPEDASEGAASSALGALAGLGQAGSRVAKAGAVLGKGGATLSRWTARPAAFTRAARATLKAMDWSGWRRGPRPNLALLQRFATTGAAAQPGKRVRYVVTPQGRALLDTPAFSALKPLFAPTQRGVQSVYDVGHRDGGRLRSDYVGITARRPGLRLIEHLNDPKSALYRGLHGPDAPRLSREVIRFGRMSDHQHGTHTAEVLLQELLRPSWNSPDKHGFEE